MPGKEFFIRRVAQRPVSLRQEDEVARNYARKSEFVIPADLGPNEAHAAREELLVWLETKRSRGKVELDGEPEEASISTLQLVIAATRSTIEKPPALGSCAEKAVASLTTPKILEHAGQ